MFFDELKLELQGGRGGSGMVSFYRQKFVAYGPPDGGDGGNGGNIVLIADQNCNTFRHFSGRKSFVAEAGKGGHKNNRAGRRGENLELKVPAGTLVYDLSTNEIIADLKEKGERFVIARGGRGGYGNAHFVSSVRQAPKFAELGDVGEHREVRLELRLLADVGLLGFPSAGKSTLISRLSEAKPKIGDYPFTTLIPNLGVVNLKAFGGQSEQSFVIADMPGIIEGAAEGKGLGHRFLKHISRSAQLVYLLDPFSYEDLSLSEQYRVLNNELKQYDSQLLEKEYCIVINKIDAIPHEDREELAAEFLKDFPTEKERLLFISGVSGEGLNAFVFKLWEGVQAQPEMRLVDVEPDMEDIPLYEPTHFVDEQSFELVEAYEVDAMEFEPPVHGKLIQDASKPKRSLFEVKGARIEQIARMTNVEQEGAVHRVYDVLHKMGIQQALLRAGASTGDYVKIGPHVFEFHHLDG